MQIVSSTTMLQYVNPDIRIHFYEKNETIQQNIIDIVFIINKNGIKTIFWKN